MIRRVLIAWMLSMAMSGSLSAQEWARKMFEVSSHDFGTVARGGKAEFAFTFTNLYKEDIHVASVRTSCGCTTPTVTNRLLKTWDKSAVVATLNTSRFLGERSATLTVVIDRPYYAEVQLQVRGYIRGDLLLSPGEIDFGTLDGSKVAHRKLRIQHAGSPAWRINAIKSPSPYITAEAVEVARNSKQVTYDLTVFLASDVPEGYVNEALVIETNDRAASRFPIEVQGRVVSELTVSPASLYLGTLQPGEKVTKQVVLKGKKPFRIVDVDCPGECFKCRPSTEAKPLHLLPVTFTAGDQPGKVTERIKIKTSLGESITELVAYAQVAEPEPEPEVEPPAKPEPDTEPKLQPNTPATPPASQSDELRQLDPPADSEAIQKPIRRKPSQTRPQGKALPNSETPPRQPADPEPDVPVPSPEAGEAEDDAPPAVPPSLSK